ncbi:hypothetical protein DFH11DRAFT_857205 [Phellopilus nigrolimitatus]|nr:hypothetical protein DFH11DRAFT_857205 [Phellopilus nigrolimitatus]
MNVSTLQVPPTPQLSWTTVQAQDREADFLSLRLLNKRSRIRLSAQPLDLSALDGKGNYFAISNAKGWFAAIARTAQGDHTLVFSPLGDLRDSIVSSTAEDEDSMVPKRALLLGTAPTHIAFGLNDERLVVGFADGSISIYDTSKLFVPGDGGVENLHTFPPGLPGPLRQIIGNPVDLPDLVAVRREAEGGNDGLAVEILDVKQLRSVGGWRNGGTAETMPTSIAWSPKGKQLAIGLRNGDIVTYSPTNTSSVKLHVPKPPHGEDDSVISIMWLSNQSFYGIYAPAGSRDPQIPQTHVLTLFDPKTNTATQTELEAPYYPSPGLRPPGAFTVVMRNWDPAKVLIFIGDSTSSDIGVIGSFEENGLSMETWCNLSLEETSTPSVPLDANAEDTVPLALEMDLTRSKDDDHPPPPILYLYASDGTLQAWHVSNEKGGSYPGMVEPNSTVAQPAQADINPPAVSSAFGQPSTAAPTFGSTSFGNAVPKFGQPSTPTFGTMGFASFAQSVPQQSESSKDGFGKNVPVSGSSPFTQDPGISAFSPGAQSAFGQRPTSAVGDFVSQAPHGFGMMDGASSVPAASPSPVSAVPAEGNAASPEAEMAEADDGGSNGFSGLSLGGSAESRKDKANGGVNNMFGAFAQSPVQGSQAASTSRSGSSTSVFGQANTTSSFGAFGSTQGSAFIKPLTGNDESSEQATSGASMAQDSAKTSKPSPIFGTSGFASAKPQSVFGQQPAFGQSAFGASSFGKPSAFGSTLPISPTPTSSPSSSTAFSAFAGPSKGFGAFAQGGPTMFGQQEQGVQSKPSEAPSITMATSSSDGEKNGTAAGVHSSSPSEVQQDSTSAFGEQSPSLSSQKQGPNVFSTPVARRQTPSSSTESSPELGAKSLDAPLTHETPKVGNTSFHSAAQSTTPFGTPSPSPFGSGAPVTTGAFANLTTTPSAFKPAEGFGAFGASTKVPNSSPFAKPTPAAVNAFVTPAKPVSVFGLGGSGSALSPQTPLNPNSSTPTFGTPSALGGPPVFGKSPFGTPVTPSPASTTSNKPATSAFGAYGNSGGFSAFAGAGKSSSFSELLKSQKDSDAQKSKPLSVFRDSSIAGTPGNSESKESGKQKATEVNEAGEDEDGNKKNLADSLKGELSFINIPQPGELDHDNFPPTPSTHGTFDEDEQDLGDEQGEDHEDADSFLSESFSEGSDGIPERGEDDSNDEEDGGGDGSGDGSGDSAGDQEVPAPETPARAPSRSPSSLPSSSTPESNDTTPKSSPFAQETRNGGSLDTTSKSSSLPTKPFPVFSKPSPFTDASKPSIAGSAIVSTGEQGVAKLSSPIFTEPSATSASSLLGNSNISGEPITIPSKPPSPLLPGKTSSLNQPSGFSSKPVMPSTSASSNKATRLPSLSKPVSSSPFGTTTPPGSPEKEEDVAAVLVPRPVAPSLSPSNSLGLGRPSSRPARSSPLANVPVSSEDDKTLPGGQPSQSVPTFPKARPASPRKPFGQVAGSTVKQDSATPTISNVPGTQQPTSKTPPPFAGLNTTPIKPPQLGSFSLKPATPPPPFKVPPGSTLSATTPPAGDVPFVMPSATSTSAPIPKSGISDVGAKTGQHTASSVIGGSSPVQQVARSPGQQIPLQTTFESSMQRECQTLYMTMLDEFEQLQKTSQAAVNMRLTFGRPSRTALTREDLGDKTKWAFGDLDAFGKLIKGLEKDVLAAYELQNEFIPIMREVESNLLKTETRKEEIVRFSKANADPEFARMLKARTLGPDASETQSQLRKQIRVINDRVEQLEAHLKASKKKLEEHRKGRPGMKPPSLDTINRTYRNIDLAIEMQTQQIATLTSRVAKLSMDTIDSALHNSTAPARSKRFTDENSFSSRIDSVNDDSKKGGFKRQVTPSIAASTAAALNAERSAMRLKNALSKARKVPLLNTQAVQPVILAPTLDSLSGPVGPSLTTAGASVSSDAVSWPLPLQTSLEHLRDEDSSAETQRRHFRQSAHAKSVKLGKTQAKLPSSIVSFDWGPLPGAKPMISLPSDIRPETIGRRPS